MSAYPLLYVAVILVCGIIAGSISGGQWLMYFIIAILGLIGMMFTFKKRIFIAFTAIFFIFSGWSLTRYYISKSRISLPDGKSVYQVCITDYPQLGNNTVKVECKADIDGKPNKILLTLSRDSMSEQLTLGDVLLVSGQLSMPEALNPESFDYGRYLRMQGYSASMYASAWQKSGHTELHGLKSWGRRQQRKVVDYYRRCGFNGRELGVLSALTIGERDFLDTDTRASFSAAGAMHVLAVSGLHVGIIYLILINIFTLFGIIQPLLKEKLYQTILSSSIIIFLWIYAVITGLSPSVVRATLMFSLGEIGRGLRRWDFGLNIVGAAAVISLLFNPLSLFTISFQLSYSAVLAIMTIGQKLDKIAVSWLHFTKNDTRLVRILKTILRYIIGLLAISLAAQIGTLPVTLYYFNQFSVYFWLTNLFVLPFAEFIAFYVLIFLPLVPAIPHAAYSLLCDYVEWIEQLPYSTLMTYIDIFQLVLLFGIIIASYRQRWHYYAALLVLVFIVYYVVLQNNNANQQKMIVYASRKADVIQIIDRGTNTVFTTDSLTALSLTQGVTLKYNLPEPVISACSVAYNIDGIGNMVVITDSLLQGYKLPHTYRCDILLAGDIGKVGAERLLENIEPQRLILLGTMKTSKKQRLKGVASANDIPCCDLMTEGAFVYDFK